MAKYTVIWDRTLESNFIDLWTKSDSTTRATLSEIANWIDDELAVDPENKGEERSEIAARSLAVSVPGARIAVIYRVLPADRQVHVMRFIFRRPVS